MLKLKYFVFVFLFFIMKNAYGFDEGYVEYQRYPFIQNGIEYNIVVLKKDDDNPYEKLPILITKKIDGEEKEISRMYSCELPEQSTARGFEDITVNGEYFTINQTLHGGWYYHYSKLTFKYIGDDKIILDNHSIQTIDRRQVYDEEPPRIYYPEKTIYFEDVNNELHI